MDPHRFGLDPAALAFLDSTSSDPLPQYRSPSAVRSASSALQRQRPEPRSGSVATTEHWVTITTPAHGSLRVHIVERADRCAPSAAVMYLHGGGWMSGDAATHDGIVRELAIRSRAAIVCPEYARAPEACYPVALEQAYATAQWLSTDGGKHGLDPCRLAIAGDSVGANLAIAAVLLAVQRSTVVFRQLVAFTPVIDADFDTASYRSFAEGFGLRRDVMQFYWDQYVPDPRDRLRDTVSPLRAATSDLARFPPSLIITAEADVVRDEGEAFAARLREAGARSTAVRYEGTIHGFAVLTALKESSAARAATAQAASILTAALEDSVSR
ncbi:alpha/beta hydrolase [Mycolicibacterium helvum]|nr:alpha/beta hydrolase [Mycolicibacterium helvum]